ncbi:MAG: 8-amino-7-oxononanoate synthase, partial [Planctomycetaceae bacterium]|nr:8-amino-7-oxononanoate synthase [Planctomycetaceae bacterium]
PTGNGRCLIDGRELHDFSSNDYLGYSQHPDVIAATVRSVNELGVGARASMLISGWTPAHQLLSQRLCELEQTPAALLFSSGYAACQGVIASLVNPEDTLFCNRLNHASLIDGCRLSQAKMRVFRHDRLEILERELNKAPQQGTRWIITETVFGMDGTLAPLADLVELAQKYNAYILCDEAHATGVYGDGGRGCIAELEESGISRDIINRHIPLRIGTLSKALGSQGGFVVGSTEVIELLWNNARTAMFSTALSIPACAAAAEAIRLLMQDSQRPAKLRDKVKSFREELLNNNLAVLGAVDCPIVPVVLKDPEATINLASKLEDEGFLVGAIRPPTVPENTSRLRISINADHTPEVLHQLAQSLKTAVHESP